MIRLIVCCVFASTFIASGASAAAETRVLFDFEANYEPSKWPGDRPGAVALSQEWKIDGARSLKIDPGLATTINEFKPRDWTAFNTLRIHVNNTAAIAATVHFELVDKNQPFHERHLNDYGVPPGESVIDVDFSAGLWRGEENKPYQGKIKTPIDVSFINRILLGNNGESPILFDRIELLKVEKLATAGGFAFDFAKAGAAVMRNFTAVNPTHVYSAKQGFGLVKEGATGATKPMSFPTQMLGAGLTWPGGFRVDIPEGGAYIGWIAFERGGFWEEEQCGYSKMALKANGTVVHEHAFAPYAPHFLFQDTEVADAAQIADKLVWPSAAITTFKFTAAKGGNTFLIQAEDSTRLLRVAGLILAPDTDAGRAFIAQHEQFQREAITKTFTAQDRSRRGKGRAVPPTDLTVDVLLPGVEVYPRDIPRVDSVAKADLLAVRGQTVSVQLGVYARKNMTVNVEARTGAGVETRVSHGRYMPQRPYGTGAVWVDINHYRPAPSFTCGPELARALLVEFTLPADAPKGRVEGEIALRYDGGEIKVPVGITVIPVALPEVPFPFGLFRNAAPFPAAALGDEKWWAVQESLLAEQGHAGLNMASGGEDLGLKVENGELKGERALKFLALAKKHGLSKAVTNYGGFLPRGDQYRDDIPTLAKAVAAAEASGAIPPLYFYVYDEPTTDDQIQRVMKNCKIATDAGLRTIGYTSAHFKNPLWVDLAKNTHAPAMNLHSPEDLKRVKEMGRAAWIYNQGGDRHGFGLHAWRHYKAGAEGRMQWIGVFTQGFAFNNVDGREPSYGCFMIHGELGALKTPMWLAAREGLLDLRIRLALEKAAPADDPVLKTWDLSTYRTDADHDAWTDEKLEEYRQVMLKRLAELAK